MCRFATMDYKVIQQTLVESDGASIEKNVKESVLLSGAWDGKYAIAVVVVDGIRPKAEIHEKAVDVWQVLKGNATFVLGGALENLETIREGEHVADAISGGEAFEVGEGDVIDVPPGVPHQIDPKGGRIEFLITKINL